MPPLARRLRDAATALHADRITVQSLAHAHGPMASGSLMLLLAVPCLIPVPGVGTTLSFGVAALAIAMWRGDTANMPQRVARLEISRHSAQRVLRLLARVYALAARFTRTRATHVVTSGPRSWVALTVGAMAFVLLPPFPNADHGNREGDIRALLRG